MRRLVHLMSMFSILTASFLAGCSSSRDSLYSPDGYHRYGRLVILAGRPGLGYPELPPVHSEVELQDILKQPLPRPGVVDSETTVAQILRSHAGLDVVWVHALGKDSASDDPAEWEYHSLFRHLDSADANWSPTVYDCIANLLDVMRMSGTLVPHYDVYDGELRPCGGTPYDAFATIVGRYIYLFPIPMNNEDN